MTFLSHLTWAKNNACFVGRIGAGAATVAGIDLSRTGQAIAVLAIAVMRTVIDYRISWNFYFPPPTAKTVASPLDIGRDGR